MKPLTENEIKFIKETSWTPTIYQMNYSESELKRTPYANLTPEEAGRMYEITLADQYNLNIHELYDKTCNLDNWDEISLEYEATYLLYTFFTKEELERITDEEVTKWLKDFKYNFGYRKWDSGNLIFALEALEVYNGERVFYLQDDDVWNILLEDTKEWDEISKSKIL